MDLSRPTCRPIRTCDKYCIASLELISRAFFNCPSARQTLSSNAWGRCLSSADRARKLILHDLRNHHAVKVVDDSSGSLRPSVTWFEIWKKSPSASVPSPCSPRTAKRMSRAA